MRRVFQNNSDQPPEQTRAGFTLIELLVVISIIIALIAILLPTLSHLKNKARATQTQNLMTSLMHAIDSYFTRFDAYPGPIPTAPSALSIISTAGTSQKIMSGSQNLLLGLSYTMVSVPPFSTPAPVAIGTTGFTVNPASPTGPANYASLRPNSAGVVMPEQLPPFFTPAANQLSPTSGVNVWPLGGMTNSNGANFAFPVILDTFPDGLPILYYRRTPGVDLAASNDPSTVAAYYLNENSEYTSSNNLKSSSGATFDETAVPFNLAALTSEVQVAVPNPVPTTPAHGGYLLLSASANRFYGGAVEEIQNRSIIGGN